jgi:NTE family protein
MDGGIRSGTNVDLARGSDQVVVIKAQSRDSSLSGKFELDVEALEGDVARVAIIDPDAATAEFLRRGSLDPANRRPAAEAGLQQSVDMVSAIPGWVTKL